MKIKDERPNVLLIMTDQFRGDCLGIAGHPDVQTPRLDDLGMRGFHFPNAYSACPVCMPARRTLMSGKKASNHGVFMNYNTWLEGETLPGELSKAGYQTHLCGKLHLWPARKLYGFDSADWADWPFSNRPFLRHNGLDDYERFLIDNGINPRDAAAHGVCDNGFHARPYHLDEKYHFTNWVTDRAINFLERRDQTRPFFLKASYYHPHQPLTPPQCYWDRYINMDLKRPKVGEWAKIFDEPCRGYGKEFTDGNEGNAFRVNLTEDLQQQMQTGYYGCINHIDDQIGRILNYLENQQNTIIIFTADHGEMLGDHQWLRKGNAFEGSAGIPFLIKMPDSMKLEQGKKLDAVVELMDIMPTVLDACEIKIPDSVDGKSLLPLMRGEADKVREYLHGECSTIPTKDSGMQFLTDGKKKYIYYPGLDTEQFFDLENDPDELIDLSGNKDCENEISIWRKRLIEELKGRPEGFTDGEKLLTPGSKTPMCLPGFERSAFV